MQLHSQFDSASIQYSEVKISYILLTFIPSPPGINGDISFHLRENTHFLTTAATLYNNLNTIILPYRKQQLKKDQTKPKQEKSINSSRGMQNINISSRQIKVGQYIGN